VCPILRVAAEINRSTIDDGRRGAREHARARMSLFLSQRSRLHMTNCSFASIKFFFSGSMIGGKTLAGRSSRFAVSREWNSVKLMINGSRRVCCRHCRHARSIIGSLMCSLARTERDAATKSAPIADPDSRASLSIRLIPTNAALAPRAGNAPTWSADFLTPTNGSARARVINV